MNLYILLPLISIVASVFAVYVVYRVTSVSADEYASNKAMLYTVVSTRVALRKLQNESQEQDTRFICGQLIRELDKFIIVDASDKEYLKYQDEMLADYKKK